MKTEGPPWLSELGQYFKHRISMLLWCASLAAFITGAYAMGKDGSRLGIFFAVVSVAILGFLMFKALSPEGRAWLLAPPKLSQEAGPRRKGIAILVYAMPLICASIMVASWLLFRSHA